jgi:hypothetical protein
MADALFPFRVEKTCPSADGLDVQVAVAGTLAVYDDPLDARAFEQLAWQRGGPEAAADGVADRCMPDAVRQVCAARAADTLEAMTPKDWQAALAEAAKAVLFETGLELTACTQRDVRCTELDRRRALAAEAEAVAHRQRQKAKAEAARHETRMAELEQREQVLARYRQLKARLGDLSVEQIARHFGDVDREALYRMLISTQTNLPTTRFLWAVSGDELLGWRGGEFAKPHRRLKLPPEVAPLRSVSLLTDGPQPQLTVGGRGGVALVSIEPLEILRVYRLPVAQDANLGVNSAARAARHLWATHSGVGLIRWPKDRPEDGRIIDCEGLRGGGAVRGLCRTQDGELLCGVGDRLVQMDPTVEPLGCRSFDPFGAEVTALCATGRTALIGTADGRIWSQDLEDLPRRSMLARSGSAVGGLALLAAEPPRLIVADGGFGLRVRVLGERAEIETTYAVEGKRCRWTAAAGDYLYAVTASRIGLLAWRLDEPAKPAHWVNVRRLTHHSVVDVAVQTA